MEHSRTVGRICGIVLFVGVVSLVGCTLLQPQVDVDFTASKTEGVTPLLVEFVPLVAGDAAACYWDFGDGETSNDALPVHVYREAGTYDVFLSVTLTDGSHGRVRKEGVIEVQTAARKEGRLSSLYWLNTGNGTIHRGDRAGYQQQTVVSYIHRGQDLAVGGGYVFWTADDAIYRANYDGSGAQAIVTGQAGLQSIAVNGSAGLLYWACAPSDPYDSNFRSGSLKSATVDGTSRRTLEKYETCYEPYTWWVRCDQDTGWLYRYFDSVNFVWPTRLTSSALDDGKLQYLVFLTPSTFVVGEILGSMGGLTTMALDAGDDPAHYVYWTGGMAVLRCRVGGGDPTTAMFNVNSPRGVAVDVMEGKMYWSDSEGIHRANVDGTYAQLIYSGVRADVLVIQE